MEGRPGIMLAGVIQAKGDVSSTTCSQAPETSPAGGMKINPGPQREPVARVVTVKLSPRGSGVQRAGYRRSPCTGKGSNIRFPVLCDGTGILFAGTGATVRAGRHLARSQCRQAGAPSGGW
jgi:hypothetical protein